MVRKLIILGAGGTSREIAGAVRDLNQRQSQWDLLGYLDDDAARHGTQVDGLPVLGPIDVAHCAEAHVIIGVARAGVARSQDRGIRGRIVDRLALPAERYATVVHPSASVSPYSKIGAGTAILHNVVITQGTAVGHHVLILQNATLAHDQVVEDFVTIAPAATICGGVRLKQGCYIGAGSTILDGITVNDGALVGIGSVVMQDVPAGATVAGNPARRLPDFPRR